MTSRAPQRCKCAPALTEAQERSRRRWRIVLTLAGLALVVAVTVLLPGNLRGAQEVKPYSVQTVPNTHLEDRNNYVSNPDSLLSAQAVAQINAIAAQLQSTYGVEVAVVAVRNIGDNDAREFATELFQHWGIGQRDKDSGLLIQLVTEPPQRSIVFETGYGLEGVLPDAICYRLQQRYMLPDLQNGDYSTGMVKGMSAVSDYLKGSELERNAMLDPVSAQAGAEESSPLMTVGGIIGLLVLFFVFRKNPAALAFILSIFMRGGGGRGGGGSGGSWGGGRSGGGGSISRF